jgi:D-alanyl-D-alanine carboxypeptidase
MADKKKHPGMFIALILIVVGGAGLYLALDSKKPVKIDLPTTTAGTTQAELWSVPIGKSVPFASPTSAAVTKTATSVSFAAQTTTTAQSIATTTAQVFTAAVVAAGDSKYTENYPGIAQPAVAVFAPNEWNLMLVSRKFALPAAYSPKTAVCLPDRYKDTPRELDARVVPFYRAMYQAAQQSNAELIPYSGYRRISTQKTNFENKIASYRAKGYSEIQAVNLASQSIQPPGCSEHNAGLAMDIASPGMWDTTQKFENTKEFAWLEDHAADYGFILRYPKGAEKITDVEYEPWHWRYVGVAAAKEMKELGEELGKKSGDKQKKVLTLEEYLESRRAANNN